MNRRGFVGVIFGGIGGFFFPRKNSGSPSQLSEVAQTSKKIGRLCGNPYDQELPPELRIRGCLFVGPGRGDCEHFVGLPEVENEITTDMYGRPHGWCEICWRGEENRRLRASLFQNANNYGGEKHALSVVSDAIKNKCPSSLEWI